MINNELGKTRLTGSVVDWALEHFLRGELDTANRALQKFGGVLQLMETGELGPVEEGIGQNACQVVTGGVQKHIKEYEEALENLSQGRRGLAYGLLNRRIEELNAETIKASLEGRPGESSKAQQQLEALQRLRER